MEQPTRAGEGDWEEGQDGWEQGGNSGQHQHGGTVDSQLGTEGDQGSSGQQACAQLGTRGDQRAVLVQQLQGKLGLDAFGVVFVIFGQAAIIEDLIGNRSKLWHWYRRQ